MTRNAPALLGNTPHVWLKSLAPEIARALPHGIDVDRVVRIAYTEIRKDKKGDLARCTQASVAGALLTAAALGLEIGQSMGGEAYLAPYKGECTLIVGYKGYTKLFWQHPLAVDIEAHTVYAGDDFQYSYGLNPTLDHKPTDDPEKRGNPTHYWAMARLSTGGTPFRVLTAEQVRAIRGGKVGGNGNIADPEHWMERKVAITQLLKLLPKSTTMARALAAEEMTGTDLYTDLVNDREARTGEAKMAPEGAAEAQAPVDAETVPPQREVEAPRDTWEGLDPGADMMDASDEIATAMAGNRNGARR